MGLPIFSPGATGALDDRRDPGQASPEPRVILLLRAQGLDEKTDETRRIAPAFTQLRQDSLDGLRRKLPILDLVFHENAVGEDEKERQRARALRRGVVDWGPLRVKVQDIVVDTDPRGEYSVGILT